MAAGRIIIPNYMPALDLNGGPIAGAKIYFWQNGTTTLQSTFTDETLTVPHTNPVVADAAGVFPSIFADLTAAYTVAIRDADDVPIGGLRDVDNVQAAESQNIKVGYDELASDTGLDLVGDGTDIVLGSAVPKQDVPVGNPYADTFVKLSMKLYGDDPTLATGRGFAFMAGVDNAGAAGTDNVHDLVAGYFGAYGSPFTSGDANTVRKAIWGINGLAFLSQNSGTYNARVAELDFVNDLRPIGAADGAGYTAEVFAGGLEIFHSGPHGSTAGLLINVGADGSVPFIRGYAVAPGAASQSAFADYSNAAYSFDSRGSHAYGLHFLGAYSNGHVLNGALAVGTTNDPGSGLTLDVYGATRLRSTLLVDGETRIAGSMNVGGSGAPEAGIDLDVQGNSKIRGFLNVLGATNLSGSFGVTLDGSLKSVSVGANDSGGSGFKVLRIAN